MKRLKIYLDTSVISHLDAPDVPDREADTKRLWEEIRKDVYDVVISDLASVEIDDCSEPKRTFMLSVLADISCEHVQRNKESERLSALYVEMGGLPPKSKNDATHIAIATSENCDVILSWNFRHIVNIRAMTAVDAVNIREGYKLIRILSPSMMLQEEE
jgi:predicted nucleic acid-binding protein